METRTPAPFPTPATSAPAPRWAVRAAHLAALVTLPAGVWRIALVLGIPAGYTAEGFAAFETPGAKAWMLFLSMATELPTLLTLGLVCPWGEVLPRRLPRIGGRTVHPLAATVPALVAASASSRCGHRWRGGGRSPTRT